MKIEQLKLTNFRNYRELEIHLHPNINLFIGENGSGKTNILESIYILSLTKSNRAGVEENFINFQESFARIEGLIYSNGLLKKQMIYLDKNKKQLFINNKEIRRNRDYISNLCVIAFTPSDLDIIQGSPNVRRSMLNIDISQLSKNYISYLNEYNQIIKIRNEFLKRISINGNSDQRYLEVLNNSLVEKAVKIYEYRFEFIKKINDKLPSIYKKITNLTFLNLQYNNSLGINSFNEEEIRKSFFTKLKKNYHLEVSQGMTLVGPHRDDFAFQLNDLNMKNFASQGQQRMAVIALKISEIYLFKQELGEYPVLLLDDIFSEIDNKKKNKIMQLLNNDIQTIITTTDVNNINMDEIHNAFLFQVKKGKVTKKGVKKNGRRESNSKL